jgi:hypothetical protein
MTLISETTLDGVVIDGTEFAYGVPLEEYKAVIGEPSRSESPGAPAPYGHRNNVIHFYDHLGLLLREHHATYVISSVKFLLDPLTSMFPTSSPYIGELWVCGVKAYAGMKFKEFADQCEVEFKPHLGHAWYVDGKHISIQVKVVAPSRKRGSRRTVISEVAVAFRGANWLSVVS